MSPSKKPQTPIRFPPHIRARLDAEVERLGVSLNTVVVMYLDRSLPPLSDGSGVEPEPDTPVAPPRPSSDVADFD
jgi:hypothetical protein